MGDPVGSPGRDVTDVDAARVRRVGLADVAVSPAPTRAEAPDVVLEVALRRLDRVLVVVLLPESDDDVLEVPGAAWAPAAAAACAAAASALVRARASSSTNEAGVW